MEARRSLYLAALVAMPLLGVLLLQNTARTATGSTTVVRMVSAAKHANSYQEEASGNLTAHMQHLYQLSFGKYGAWRREDWSSFQPIISCPPERPLTKYGEGDGSKLLCKLKGVFTKTPDCVIYSLGSNGDYQFEEAMLRITSCQVHTFDCTYSGKSVDKNRRHHYHEWCIGIGGDKYRSWDNITRTLAHDQVDLLKMDIEGYEYAVLSSFQREHNLPKEISMEFHVNLPKERVPEGQMAVTAAELSLAFMHLSTLGYATYSQEVNALAPDCCCEFSFLRVN